MSYRIEIGRGAVEAAAEMEALVVSAHREALASWFQRLSNYANEAGNIPKATGNLIRTILAGAAASRVEGLGYIAYLGYPEYAEPLDEGHFGFPPVNAILAWMIAKPITLTPDKNGNTPSMESVAFLIARKISEEGSTPHPFIDALEEYAEATLEEELRTAYTRYGITAEVNL